MHASANPREEKRFNRSARLVLLFALFFIALTTAQLAYRLTLPTEGWLVRDSDTGPGITDYPLSQNLVGAPSPLLPGDALRIIGGVPTERIINSTTLYVPQPTGWRVGGQVIVTVIRGGQMLTFDIPIVNWTLGAWWHFNFDNLSSILSWLSALILLAVGGFTFFNRPNNPAARFLLLFGVAYFATNLSDSLPDAIGFNFYPIAAISKALFSYVIFAYMFGPSLLDFALTFPRPKAPIRQRPALLLLPYLIGATAPLLLLVNAQLSAIGFPLTLGMLILAVVSLIHSGLTMRDTISRAQMRWAVGGVVAGLALFALNYTINLPKPLQAVFLVLAAMGLPVMGISLSVAILRYRLFDIDIIIRRTLIYSVLTALLALFYFGSVVVLQQLFRAMTGAASDIAIIISTLAIAALFNPLRHRVQSTIDHRFYRRKYDAQKVLAQFGVTARDEVELSRLTEELLVAAEETMQPVHQSLWIAPVQDGRERTL